MRTRLALASATICVAVVTCRAQTTKSLISGRITDTATGRAIASAKISCERVATGISRKQLSGHSGFYTMPLLPPGIYHIRAEAEGYQAREVYELELAVASSLELDLPLRPLK